MSTFNKYRLKGAFHYDWYETEDWYKYLVDRCVKFCKGKTLDVGCGDAVVCKLISDNGYEVVGIDNDPTAIKLAKESVPKGKFMMRQPARWSSDSVAPFEYLVCLNAIEHFTPGSPMMGGPEHVKEMIKYDVTKGAIITTIDYQGGTLGEDHKFEWTLAEMVEFFKEFNPKPFRYKDTEWIGVEITK